MEADAVIIAKIDCEALDIMTQECIDSLVRSEDDIDFNIFLELDDGKESFGYNKLLCRGIQKGNSEYVLLCNNDLIFYPKFFTEILRIERQTEAATFCSWNPDYHERFFKTNNPYYHGYRIAKEFCGWMICAKREVLEKVDFCSPEFQITSFWFADNLLRDVLQKNNYLHVLCRHSRVRHLLSQTLKRQPQHRRMELTKQQKALYESGRIR